MTPISTQPSTSGRLRWLVHLPTIGAASELAHMAQPLHYAQALDARMTPPPSADHRLPAFLLLGRVGESQQARKRRESREGRQIMDVCLCCATVHQVCPGPYARHGSRQLFRCDSQQAFSDCRLYRSIFIISGARPRRWRSETEILCLVSSSSSQCRLNHSDRCALCPGFGRGWASWDVVFCVYRNPCLCPNPRHEIKGSRER